MFRFLRLLIIIICLWGVSGALEPTDVEASEELRFLHNDHLGSVVAVSDERGEKVWEERYLPFGSNVSNSVTSVNQTNTVIRQYTGQERDDETNLYNYNARLYNPRVGQFVSSDKIGEDGENKYAYVRNNPLRFIDPSGNAFEHGDGGGGGKSGLELQISGGSALEQQPEIAATQPTAFSQTHYQPPPVEWREAEFVWLMTNVAFASYTFPLGVKWLQALYGWYQLDKLARSQPVQTVQVISSDIDAIALREMRQDLTKTKGRILDIGGYGVNAEPQFIEEAVSLNPKPYLYCELCGGIEAELPVSVKGLGESAPFADETFSVIKSRYLYREALNPEMFSSMRRLLLPGGKIYITTSSDVITPEFMNQFGQFFSNIEIYTDYARGWQRTLLIGQKGQ